ncbi:SAM-dependent methyltransferase [Limisalsivibrio acetivorans]|uniref:SAM-dependent methyltransferase n=1 Tax=Limisalsivibrio acetivorans TaxID=1304888 RepID=UPI0003B4446F|nr:methyltransferase domain-containing protein [Limisalsivibrio acetivorans]
MSNFKYAKSQKYTNLHKIYEQCSGPGGLKLAEFMAEKMQIHPDKLLLDLGCNRGYQTCFIAKEYAVRTVAVDPWDDRMDGRPMVEHLIENASEWGVLDRVIGMKIGVPDLFFASKTFDYIYSTTALEMVRVSLGAEGYRNALLEIRRVMKDDGILGIAEPMHYDVEIPEDLLPYVSSGEYPWKDCFRSLEETKAEIEDAGFEVLESGYPADATEWWQEFVRYDPFEKNNPEGDAKTLEVDNGRWTSFGYLICKKR